MICDNMEAVTVQGSDVTTDNALGEFLGKRTALERMLMVVIILIMFIMAILIIAFTCSTARPLQSEQGLHVSQCLKIRSYFVPRLHTLTPDEMLPPQFLINLDNSCLII